MRLLLLTFLLTVAFGDIYEKCIPFEAGDEPRGIYIENTHENDTSILVYNRADIGKTNIPKFVYSMQSLIESEESFGICSELNVTEGVCDGPVGTFNVKVTGGDGSSHGWLNVVLHQGENVKYDIHEEGNYCVAAYRRSNYRLDKLIVQEVHNHGFLSRRGYNEFRVYQLQLVLLIATAIAMYFTFQKNKKSYLGDIFKDFVLLIVLQLIEVSAFNIKFMIMNTNVKFSSQDKVFELYRWLKDIFENLDLLVFYKLSLGAFGYGKVCKQQLTVQPIFVLYIVGFGVCETVLAFRESMHTTILARIIMSFLSIMRYSLWVPTLFLIFENSDMTFKGILNPIYANKYFLTRRVLFLVPLALEFISSIGSNLVSEIMMNNRLLIGNDIRSHQLLMDSVFSNFLVQVLNHLEDFSQVVAQWLLLYIWVWKPTNISLAEQEASTSIELNDLTISDRNTKLA